ncbi:methyl-accepting chemotaxis protein [Tateyamaria armeniaca]|uniref:Methyl-accepting chemotaxis protein n=1 Tax=Tateyamaria armeniaca TaxID=2518930 RepID=A0ABW8UW70_9RHOB
MPRIDTASHDDTAALFAQRRAAIDLIATTRAKTIRAALFATYLFRPHPTHPEDEETRDGWRAVLQEQCDDMERLCTILTGRDPQNELPREVCAWICEHSANHPEAAKAFARTRDLTVNMMRAVEADNQTELGRALEAHKAYGRSGFFQRVTDFCDGLWAHLDEKRHQEVLAAQATARAISKTLARLEHIGKHVRLVSLNASVEASRVGDAGRGLGVIAVEFKTLAEEIQHLAVTARDDIRKMATGTKTG